MANYVKFLRGSPEAYEKLRHKDSDTLYFIYEEDEANGSLYLGSKLIAGEDIVNESSGVSSLAELKDVLLSEDLNAESFLVYDPRAVAWVNKPLEDLIFMGATPQSAGLVGLVPAPELGQTDLFLRSDGTWSSPSAIDHFVLTIENKNHKSHYDLILEAIENLDCISGDIIIIKDLISNNKWQYVAYVFDNGNWHAMDGNYNAENVYFDEDLITTTEIGNITLTDGKAVIATAGKNLKEVFETIFVKEENPTIVDPYIILTCKEAKAYEVGTVIKPTYSASLNSGTYSFGPATGVTVTGWSIVDSNGNGSVNNSGEFVDFIVKDNIDYSITATAMYSNGNIPLTNLGNKYPEGAIKAGSTTIT